MCVAVYCSVLVTIQCVTGLSITWTGDEITNSSDCVFVNVKLNLDELLWKHVQWNRWAASICVWWCHNDDDVIVCLSSCLSELKLEVFLLWPHFLRGVAITVASLVCTDPPTSSNQNSLCYYMIKCGELTKEPLTRSSSPWKSFKWRFV